MEALVCTFNLAAMDVLSEEGLLSVLDHLISSANLMFKDYSFISIGIIILYINY